MKSKLRICIALLAVLVCLGGFSTIAYAGGGEEYPDVPIPTEEPESPTAPTPEATVNPFTPDGTGTVLDNATDGDGKEFYTIITADEHVFYLIIDRQKESENVYFLNAVTIADLMALAEDDGSTSGESAIPSPQPESTPQPVTPTPDPDPEPQPEPEKSGSGGTIIFLILAALAAGGVGFYFKAYKPKKQRAAEADENDDFDFDGPYEDDFDESDTVVPLDETDEEFEYEE